MSDKKFEMRLKTPSGQFDTYYPRTTIDQVVDLPANLNNKVDLTSTQTISGNKTFTSQIAAYPSDNDYAPIHVKLSKEGVGSIWSSIYNTTAGGWIDSQIYFPDDGEGQYDIKFPNKSGTLATTDEAGGGIIDVDTLPEITEDNSRVFAREEYKDLHYPRGTSIIEGEGERDLNTAGNTGNKDIQFLIDDFNGMGKNFVDSITLDETQGYLRGSNPSSFKPFWTIGGYEGSGGREASFVLNDSVTSITLYMTTGFSVATGGPYEGLIPSNYPEIHITDNFSSGSTAVESVSQGEDPNDVVIETRTITNDGDPFDEFLLKWFNAEGTTLSSTKINIYRVEATFVDSSTVYVWDLLADVNYVNTKVGEVNTALSTEVSTRSLETSALDVRVTTNEDNITELQNYVGDIQFELVYSALPTPGPTFVNKVFRFLKKFYQCFNNGSSEYLAGSFSSITGTSAIVVDNCDDIELCWNRKIKVKTSVKAYRDPGRIKLSSSSALGYIDIGLPTDSEDDPINKVSITVKPYIQTSGGKSSVFTVTKTVDSTTTTLLDLQELPAGTVEYTYEFTNLNLGTDGYLRLLSQSSTTSQDRRLYITLVAITLGNDNYVWQDICHGGGGSSNIFINPYNIDNSYVCYLSDELVTKTFHYDDSTGWFVDADDNKVSEKYIFNRPEVWLLEDSQVKNETTDEYIDFTSLTVGTTLVSRNDSVNVKSIPALTLQYALTTIASTIGWQFIPVYAESVMLMPRISAGNVYCAKDSGDWENKIWDSDHDLYFTIRVDEGEVLPGDEFTINAYKYTGYGKNHPTAYHRYRTLFRYEILEEDLQTPYYKQLRLIRVAVPYYYVSALRRTYDLSARTHTKIVRIGRPIYKADANDRIDTLYSNNVNYDLLFTSRGLTEDRWYVRPHLL